jgi:hypothetical protein
MGKESGDFLFAHFLRMALAVEKNVAPDPLDVGCSVRML